MAKPKKDKYGRYRKNLTLGRRPDGSYIRKTVYGKTQKELEQRVLALTQELNHGIQVWESTMTFRDLANLWFDEYHADENERWRYSQEGLIKKHLLPTLGDMKVRDIRQLHLQVIISGMAKQGFATGTMKKVKQTAERIMKVAVGSDLIIRNPFSEVRVPTKPPNERRALTEQEISLITDTWRGHNLGLMAMLMLYAGLRRGEAQALEWTDIDFERRVIMVSKSASTVKNTTTIKTPKTKAGVREIPIPNVLLAALMEKRKAKGYVCTSASGEFLTMSSYASQWKSYLHHLNVCAGGQNGAGPYIHRIEVIEHITAHMLRHTYATMLFDANVDVKSAQKFLGHADVEVTLSIYTHLTKYKEDKAIAALNGHLDEMIEKNRYSNNVISIATKQ